MQDSAQIGSQDSHREGADFGHTIGVALSGGGNRAALFGLGALLYLVDSGLNSSVTSIASVSGGSITNALIAQSRDFRKVTPDQFAALASELASAVVHRGLVTPTGIAAAYLGTLATAGVFMVLVWITSWPIRVPWYAWLVILGLWSTMLFLRGTLLSHLLERRLLGGRTARLDKTRSSVEHVFCATDIGSGSPFYFSTWNGGQVFSPLREYRWGSSGRTRFVTAVRASAAFPGAFPPKRIQTKQFDFTGKPPSKVMYLADGGVWNNLATEWYLGGFQYAWPWADTKDRRVEQPDIGLVVNASSALKDQSSIWLAFPLLGEFIALVRTMRTLYKNTVEPRIRHLDAARRAAMKGRGAERRKFTPFVIDIDRPLSAIGLPERRVESIATRKEQWDQFLRTHTDRPVADIQGAKEARKLHTFNPSIATTLGRLSAVEATSLIAYSYLATAANFFVFFSGRLLAPWDSKCFQAVVRALGDPPGRDQKPLVP